MDPVVLVLLVMLVTSGVAFLAVIFFWMLVGSDRRQSKEPQSPRPSMKMAPGIGYSGRATPGRATPGRATSDSGVDSTSMWVATDFGGVSTGSYHCSSGSSWGGGDCGGGGSSGGGDCGGGGGGGGGCD